MLILEEWHGHPGKFSYLCGNFADVAELVDASDLGSDAFGRGGSSPFIRTDKKEYARTASGRFF